MLFLHPMWDSESQRIGMKKCWPLAYFVHGVGELIGFLGLLALGLLFGYMVWTNSFSWLLVAIPFAMGMLSEFMVQVGWRMVFAREFSYDGAEREASWAQNGQRVAYRYKCGDS